MRTLKFIILTQVLFTLSGCAGLLGNRSFIDQMDHDSGSIWVAGQDFDLTSGDSGRAHRSRDEILERTPVDGLTREQALENKSVRDELVAKLNSLTDEQYTQYSSVRDHLDSDSEKIYYLNLPAREREEYVRTKMFSVYKKNMRAPASHNFGYKTARAPTVSVGMRKNDIMKIWGRPAQVDVAGDPRYENERWSFYDGSQIKQIYFENGQVSGWILE